MRCRGSSLRWGLSLVEMIISIPLVGIALVAALNTVGASKVSEFKTSIGREGHLLAQALMSEILQQDYMDATIAETVRDDILSTGDATYTLGPDNFGGNDEVATGDRSLFNDVDDYDGWSASPPQAKDGTAYALTGWARSVSVVFTGANDLNAVLATDFGRKRITVTVTHNGVPAAELVALSTIGLPWLEACCFGDGSCEDLRAEACTAQGGTAMGPEMSCATTECPSTTMLFVTSGTCVFDPGSGTTLCSPTAEEQKRIDLIESWDIQVVLISHGASQSDFDTAVADTDVAYINVGVDPNVLGTKLTTAPIGVVNTHPSLLDDLGYSSGSAFYVSLSVANIVDNTHFITSTFATGTLTLSTSDQWFVEVVSGLASGAQVLATIESNKDSLFVFEIGAQLVGGTPAPGRRIQLLWGDVSIDFDALTVDARTIMKRAIEWGAGLDVICGDAFCGAAESPCDCPADCGAPTAFEQPGLNCGDGVDNDCDGAADCDDANCTAAPACMGTFCGDGTCDPGEDCNNCSLDCPSRSDGRPRNQYCCGNGIAESAEGDGTICDGNY